ncbi:MAG: glutamate 5-kinase [Spirochaetes bacterium]|nr:glutamate 5-kinase [Spirochaetota bacterium]
MRKKYLENTKRIVVKVGTKSITGNIKLDPAKIKSLVSQLAGLKKKKYEIVLVTSGAISAGIGELGLTESPRNIPEKQAAASIGQIALMAKYHDLFKSFKIKIGQILLTESDLKDRQKYLNAKNTLITLLRKYDVIPIINENDVVGIEEIIFGDNDELSALIANLVDADLLILLSDVDGFFYKGRVLQLVEKLSSDIMAAAGDRGDQFSTGGMKSKLNAVKISINSGIPVIIANHKKEDILKKVVSGKNEGTFFCPSEKGLSQKKRWLAYSVVSHGKILIDDGAKNALIEMGKSLLPGGIVKAEGRFNKGEPVDVCDKNGEPFGRGLVNYERGVVELIKGKKTEQIRSLLKEKFYTEVIHRDNLVIF